MTEFSEPERRSDRGAAFDRKQGFLSTFCVAPRHRQETMLWCLTTDELRDLAAALMELQARIGRALGDGAADAREAFLASRRPGSGQLRLSPETCGCMLISMACRVNETKMRELLWQLPSDQLGKLQRALAHLRPRIEECLAAGADGRRAAYLATVEDKRKAPKGRSRGVEALSPREREIMSLVPGYTAKEIADALSISESTVRTHIENILNALGLRNQSKLIDFGNGHDCLA